MVLNITFVENICLFWLLANKLHLPIGYDLEKVLSFHFVVIFLFHMCKYHILLPLFLSCSCSVYQPHILQYKAVLKFQHLHNDLEFQQKVTK